MQHLREKVVFFTAVIISLIAFSGHVESRALESSSGSGKVLFRGSIQQNSSAEIGTGPVDEDLKNKKNATDTLFQELLTCPEGTSEDVWKCMEALSNSGIETCAGAQPTYNCVYFRGFLKCEGVGRELIKIFANGFNKGVIESNCSQIIDGYPSLTAGIN